MDIKSFIRLENEDEDFPFYNDNPKLEKKQWLLLLGGIIVTTIFIFMATDIPRILKSTIMFLMMIIPIAIVSKGKLGYLFKRPKLRDFVLIILLLIGYSLYCRVVFAMMANFGINPTPNEVLSSHVDSLLWIGILFQLVAEELLKIIPFLMITYVLYRHTQNRKMSVIIALLATLIFFGFLHFKAYEGNLAQIILIIGLGNFFNMFAYIKTKNVTVSLIYHILLDLPAILLAMLV